jgi:hypothetical protein
MTHRGWWVIGGLLVLVALWVVGDSRAAAEVKVTGTFSDMYFNEEGGDVLGTEVRIVVGSRGYQAAVQIGQGQPSDLMVVNVWTSGDSIRFSLPGGDRFEGRITSKYLAGKFLRGSARPEVVKLARGRSYWDR